MTFGLGFCFNSHILELLLKQRPLQQITFFSKIKVFTNIASFGVIETKEYPTPYKSPGIDLTTLFLKQVVLGLDKKNS